MQNTRQTAEILLQLRAQAHGTGQDANVEALARYEEPDLDSELDGI